jgi:hypothetical protein
MSEETQPPRTFMDKLLDVEMTGGDRLRSEGRDQGRTEGKLDGERTMLLRMLTLMFGEAPSSVVARIQAIQDEETLAQVAQQLVTIQSLHELILPEMAE